MTRASDEDQELSERARLDEVADQLQSTERARMAAVAARSDARRKAQIAALTRGNRGQR